MNKKIYTNDELQELELDVHNAGGETKWLEKQGAIRVDEKGNISVVGYMDGTNEIQRVPYAELSEKLHQLGKYQTRREYAQRASVEAVTGEKLVGEKFLALKEKFNLKKL